MSIKETLVQFKKEYPKLTFNKNGYNYIDKAIKETYKRQIKQIEDILKKKIDGFVEFNNFKDRDNGSFDIRCQYYWDSSFVGVGYFNIEEF